LIPRLVFSLLHPPLVAPLAVASHVLVPTTT
jgi:hypothetical protein